MARLLPLAGLLTLAWTPIAQAQAQGTLILVLRTGPEISQGFIDESVETTLKKISPSGRVEDVVKAKQPARLLTPFEYGIYNRIDNPDAPAIPLPSVKSDLLEIRQLPATDPTWQIKLNSDKPRSVAQVDLEFDGAKGTKTYTPKDPALTMPQPGTYTLTLPKDQTPSKYTIQVREIGQPNPVPVTGDFPRGDNFFLIRLEGFVGNRDQFVKTIQDPGAIGGVALDALDIQRDVTVAVGEAKAGVDEQEPTIVGPNLILAETNLKRGTPARVWMRFPLTKAQAEAEQAAFTGLGPGAVSRKIRESNETVPFGEPVVITDESTPRWIELPRVTTELQGMDTRLRRDTFGRVVPLVDADATRVTPEGYQRLLAKYPNAYRLLVYEFDDGQTRNAIPFRPSNQKTMQAVNVSELAEWPGRLAQLAKPAAK